LLLADITARTDLAPGASEPKRAQFLRWLILIVTNIYPTFTRADDPARFISDEVGRSSFRANVDAYAKRLWGIMEAAAAGPWFLGDRFSAVDIFIATMTQWRPQRPWFAAHTPKLAAIAARTDALPELASVWNETSDGTQNNKAVVCRRADVGKPATSGCPPTATSSAGICNYRFAQRSAVRRWSGEPIKSTLNGSSQFPSGRVQSIQTATPKNCVLRWL
jgi:hypothetical protein